MEIHLPPRTPNHYLPPRTLWLSCLVEARHWFLRDLRKDDSLRDALEGICPVEL